MFKHCTVQKVKFTKKLPTQLQIAQRKWAWRKGQLQAITCILHGINSSLGTEDNITERIELLLSYLSRKNDWCFKRQGGNPYANRKDSKRNSKVEED